MMRGFLLSIAAAPLAAVPAVAQQAPAAPATPAAQAPADPARLAAARPVIDQVWPLGTYARIMQSAMDQVMGGMLASMYDMPASEFAKMGPNGKAGTGADGNKTLRQLAAEQDPHFEERMRIGMTVMMQEMTGLMAEVEPDVRTALASAYARRFTTQQLGELRAFFDTPTGRVYAAESMTLMMGPDMMGAMQSFTPKILQRMPGIVAKVEAATAHLPPPPKKSADQ